MEILWKIQMRGVRQLESLSVCYPVSTMAISGGVSNRLGRNLDAAIL